MVHQLGTAEVHEGAAEVTGRWENGDRNTWSHLHCRTELVTL